MDRRRGFGIVIAAAAVGVTVAANVGAAPASSTLSRAGSRVVDSTYSCKVRAGHYIDLESSVTLPPEQGNPHPARLAVTTVKKGFQQNGFTFYVPQVLIQAAKDSLEVDRPTCRRSSRKIALKPSGLPTPPEVVTPSYLGSVNGRCVTTKRVLVHLRITMKEAVPQHALVAVRDDDEKSKPVAFYRWSPRKITGYLGKSCVSS
ncbi:MAG: hypothetical protein ACRDL7_01555 [Gaiellaceae bacterium]